MVKECVHIDTGRYYAAKVINKRMMAGREHMVRRYAVHRHPFADMSLRLIFNGPGTERNCRLEKGVNGSSKHPDVG